MNGGMAAGGPPAMAAGGPPGMAAVGSMAAGGPLASGPIHGSWAAWQ